MNRASGFKLAVDIPTGLISDTGKVLGEAFKGKIARSPSIDLSSDSRKPPRTLED